MKKANEAAENPSKNRIANQESVVEGGVDKNVHIIIVHVYTFYLCKLSPRIHVHASTLYLFCIYSVSYLLDTVNTQD
jgi:hypothetical protein